MCIEETTILRYCYQILQKRIVDNEEGLAYWRMNLKIATYFLKRYDPGFDPDCCLNDHILSDIQKNLIAATHPLLQRPAADRGRYPSLTKELELQLKKRVAKYFNSRAKE